MAEIVSRFTFFPADEQQSLRFGRFRMAAGAEGRASNRVVAIS